MQHTAMTKSAFLFAPQGSQHKGMGKGVFDAHPVAKEVLQLATRFYGAGLEKLALECPQKEIARTDNAQILITMLNIIFHQVAVERGYRPDIVLGHSVGELAALFAAGVLDLEDLLRFVVLRGRSMCENAERYPGAMLSVYNVADDALADLVQSCRGQGTIGIACYNAPGLTVVSGDAALVDRIKQAARKLGGRTADLGQQGAWHSAHMASTRDACYEFLSRCTLRPPAVPLLFNISADLETDPERIRTMVCDQITSPVRWRQSMERLASESYAALYEVGPGRALRAFAVSTFRQHPSFDYKVRNFNSLPAIEERTDHA